MTVIAETLLPHREFAQRLAQRQAELRALLQSSLELPDGDDVPEVLDFKDVAAQDTRAKVDEVALANATAELAQIVLALRRLDDGSYGLCEDCGEPIDPRRLRALPATPYCTACQAIHERPPMPRR
jgi:DnaK suppressor protein